ncbi:hypothetical protein SDC9_87086 [bioreactor metagenome]|uniref:Uncharacterized protein n=1 Tax=bioreactor metagenome TaxID=1076179 RepID=A0A644ZHR8_9ZZZZ
MDGDKIGQYQRAAELIPRNTQLPRVFNHRNRNGNALVSAARVDDNRQVAAAHPGIAAGGGFGTRAVINVLSEAAENDAADVGTPVAVQPFLRNGAVIFDLPPNDLANVVQVDSVGKLHDVTDG